LRQGVTLSGLGSPTFESALQAIKAIHSRFDRQFEEGVLEVWAEHEPGETETDSIGLWNRYLTPAREAEGTQAAPFLPGVDPKGILRGMAQEDSTCFYAHTEDNQVHYYATRRDEDGHLVCVSPQMFRVGDVVEAQVAFMAIPVKGQKCKMLAIHTRLRLTQV